jgi:GT2 family glycosyltransferase
VKVSVCIPTRNRPDDVVQCVESIRASSIPVHEIIVSDDSSDDRTRLAVAAACPGVVFLEGPRRGLGPNRNNAVAAVSGDWVLFLDDDARLTPDFLATMAPLMAADPGDKVIFTGIERHQRGLIYPNDQDFLGYQTRPYRQGEQVRTLVMNAALFPASLFKVLMFDASLVYGYDEIDIAARALALGYRIRYCPEAINLHYPSTLNRDFNAPHIETARIYITFRKYLHAQRRPLKAAAFLAVSLAHSVAYHTRKNGLSGLAAALRTHRSAWAKIRNAPA